mgnify:FL=1
MITLTESATSKVGELLATEDEDVLALRVAAKPGGCSGPSYEMFFDTDQTSDDLEEAYGTVRVVVDPASAELLVGAILDYQEGLEQSGFSINNPDASHSCGCGKN